MDRKILVKVVLQEYGLAGEEACNGREGVDLAMSIPYDLILMDVQMPVMDGFTATRLLRDSGVKTPILALTANAMKGFEQELLEAGYSDYLTKPIDIDRFVSKLAQLLHAQRGMETVAGPTLPEPDQDLLSDMEHDSPIESKLGAKNPKFAKVIARFVTRLAEQLEAMNAAYSKRNLEELAKLAHWLKGAGGTVGFDVFFQPASDLECAAKAGDLADIEQQLQHLHRLAARIALPDMLEPDPPVKTVGTFN